MNMDELLTLVEKDDTLFLSFPNGKQCDVKVVNIEQDGTILCKSDISCNQFIYINANHNYPKIILMKNNNEYSTQLKTCIQSLSDERKRIIKAYLSNNFCDNNLSLNIIESITNMICTAVFSRVKHSYYI